MNNNLYVNLTALGKPDHNGSVQELYFLKENSKLMLCKTTPGGSVFDVGTIFSIPGSDVFRTAIRHKIYTLLGSPDEWKNIYTHICKVYNHDEELKSFLCEGLLEEFMANGAKTHHIGMVDNATGEVFGNSFPPNPSVYVVVKKYSVNKPQNVSCLSHNLWDYSKCYTPNGFVIPLENIVRFGVTSGSSIYRKYMGLNEFGKKNYLCELGLSSELVPWTVFPRPIVDFTTKYEPEDRNVSQQEAFYISGCSGKTMIDIVKMSLLGGIFISEFFSKAGLFLWDLKWEIVKDGEDLVFVDTIDTDSVRVTAQIDYMDRRYFINFNKQAMRDYYKIMHSEWFEATKSAKVLAAKTGKSFHEHLKDGQTKGIYPMTPVVDSGFIKIQEEKFNTFNKYIFGKSSLNHIIGEFMEIGRKEIQFYETNDYLDKFYDFNGINENTKY